MKSVTYTNLFGQEITVTNKKTNPMVRSCGPGPADKKCKHCKYLFEKSYSKKYFKCEWRGNTNGPGTDHRANWPTCSKFIEREES
jgi:hypothetical protein